ncbi:hypothetical protein [Calderihabitans maritimus]|uniref:Uncharacterized protein n=1 Tax=Calderihabitans maritimus TaxID=1246530 RepID=A0A1Z5HPM4_9FIRM|nr:hypothetical protein [Calderihabitans maritimus]GAW91486.1 hypothetical protein KKC1_06480 [Calderihabitans maritimus]
MTSLNMICPNCRKEVQIVKPRVNQYICQQCHTTYSSAELSRQLIQLFNSLNGAWSARKTN